MAFRFEHADHLYALLLIPLLILFFLWYSEDEKKQWMSLEIVAYWHK